MDLLSQVEKGITAREKCKDSPGHGGSLFWCWNLY